MGVSIRMKAKRITFDRNILKVRWKRINEGPLKKAGLRTRRIAINSIRTVAPDNQNPSKPGKPYRSRSQNREVKKIFSVLNGTQTSVMIGPVGFGPKPVPELHEKGLGAIRLLRVKGLKRRGPGGRFVKSKPKFKSAYINYPKRPVMTPAVEKVEPSLPAIWRNSVKP